MDEIGAPDFERALEAMADLVLIKRPGSRLWWANESFRDRYGTTNDELVAIEIDADHADPDDTVQYLRDDHEVITTGRSLDVGIEPITAADGTVGYFHTIKSPLVDRDGAIVGSVGVSRPVEDERLIESTADERAARHTTLEALRSVVAALPSPLAMFDASHRIMAWSNSLSELLPSARSIEPGTPIDDLLPLRANLEDVLSTDETHRTVFCSGDLQLSAEVRTWRTADERARGTVVALSDVTELLAVQTRLEQVNDELQQFNYRASHDLSAPLASTSGVLRLADELLEDGAVDEARELLVSADAEVTRLRSLVGDLMRLARADVAADDVEQIELGPLVDEVVRSHQRAIEEAGVEVELHLDTTSVWAVEVRMRQALDNLVSNAVKFVDPTERSPSLTISSTGTDPVVICVEDNGVGMQTDQADSLFDLFARGSTDRPGHGLGLYIVRKHLRRLGGDARVSSPSKPTVLELIVPGPTPRSPSP